MKKILMIHPDGNINQNPNLSAIVELICKNGYEVEIISPGKPQIYQGDPCSHAKMILLDSPEEIDKELNSFALNNYSLIIGIDQGIIPASKIAQISNIPLGLISYELTFTDEIGWEKKQEEIKACQNLVFAVCQDNLRSYFLSKENGIDQRKIINIPVAGRYTGIYKKSDYLHKQLNIMSDKKIALYTGSLASWVMMDELMNQAINWPEDWVLVLHERYTNRKTINHYRKFTQGNPKIIFSDLKVDRVKDLARIIYSADLGLAFYQCKPNNPTLGKNLLFIGLSSGKISTYLQYGIPVIINQIGEMGDYIRKYNLGAAVQKASDIDGILLENLYRKKLKDNCLSFFRQILDFSIYEKGLLQIINQTASGKKLNEQEHRNLYMNYNYEPDSHILETQEIYRKYSELDLKYQKILGSWSFRILSLLLHPLESVKKLWYSCFS